MHYLKTPFPAALRLSFVVAAALFLLTSCQADNGVPRQQQARPQPTPPPPPAANVIVDEPMLAKPYAIIGGAVENIGQEKLEKLSVVVELKRRADASTETREVSVAPADLAPGQQGKFSLKVLSEEWSGSRVVKLQSGAGAREVAFKSLPGAKRPPEKTKDNIVVTGVPAKKKSGGGDFINTPDTPINVP